MSAVEHLTIEILPNEILFTISQFLDNMELYQLSMTNRSMNKISNISLSKGKTAYLEKINRVNCLVEAIYLYMTKKGGRAIELEIQCKCSNGIYDEKTSQDLSNIREVMGKMENVKNMSVLKNIFEKAYKDNMSIYMNMSARSIQNSDLFIFGMYAKYKTKFYCDCGISLTEEELKNLLFEIVYRNVTIYSSRLSMDSTKPDYVKFI